MSNNRNSRVVGGEGRRIRLNPPSPTHEVADDVVRERNERREENTIKAEYVEPGLTDEEYRSRGFSDLPPNSKIVGDIDKSNYVEHVNVDGESRLYKAANYKKDKFDPDNLLEARDVTNEPTDSEEEIKMQREALEKGGFYRLLYIPPDKKSRTGGAFCFFLKEEFTGSLAYLGIYKKSEWEKLSDIEIFNSCLVHCFRKHKHYERLFYSKASIYTLCSKKVFETICDIIESNITVQVISETKNKVKKNGMSFSNNRQYRYVGKDGKRYDNTFEICLLMGHYFPFVSDTSYTTKYIKNCVWKDEEKELKKLITKYGLYSSKTKPLNSFNLVKMMIEQKDDYFEPFQSQMLREPRKEKLDEKILFNDYEQFDVGFDCRECESFNGKPDEYEEILENEEEIEDEEEYFNSLLDNIEINGDYNSEKQKIDRKIEYDIYHADIETAAHGNEHVPYLMAFDHNDYNEKQCFWEGDGDCIKRCLTAICKKHIKRKKIIKNLRLIIKFQNLGYDIRFIRDYLSFVYDSVEPSKSKVYRLDGSFKVNKTMSVRIRFVDQYPQIPMKLADYEKAFHLKKGKFSDFPHFFYNDKTDYKRSLKAPHCMYNKLIKIFPKEYIREIQREKGSERTLLVIEHIKYAEDYCMMDVETQKQGWNCMWKQVMDQLGLDYNNYMTISNLSKAYCIKEGCYEGVNQIRGKTSVFIRKSVIGGRTMSKLHNKENPGIWILNEREGDELQNGFDFDYEDEEILPEKDECKFIFHHEGEYDVTFDHEYKKISKNPKRKEKDLELNCNPNFVSPRPKLKPEDENENLICGDINSLYPDAITDLKGYPKGPAKNIPKEDLINKKFIDYSDEFHVKILILKVIKKLDFPSLTKIGERGERLWTNDMEGDEMYVDRITLEELIKYHEIEYECKTGVMFNEGYNTKIGEVIRKLYDLRTKYKKEGNPLQLLYKLMLNTAYGKTIQKPKDTKILWRNNKTTNENKLIKTFGESIQYIVKPREGKKLFKAKIRIGIVNHWSMPQCGSLVLSQSKRIMNKFLANYGEDIYYTDTDSIFMKEKKYLELKETKPELFGDELGQIKEEKHLKGNCVRITKAMFLAAKIYWVREENEKGEIYDKITMKGIPEKSVEYTIRQKFNGNVETLFYGLINRKKGVLFDLTLGGDCVRMDFSEISGVVNLDVFSRRLGGFR